MTTKNASLFKIKLSYISYYIALSTEIHDPNVFRYLNISDNFATRIVGCALLYLIYTVDHNNTVIAMQ
jgi:hypothetical protein